VGDFVDFIHVCCGEVVVDGGFLYPWGVRHVRIGRIGGIGRIGRIGRIGVIGGIGRIRRIVCMFR
jgi:hypothetical protein